MRLTPELRTKRDAGLAGYTLANSGKAQPSVTDVWNAAWNSALAALGWRWGTAPAEVFPLHAFRKMLHDYRCTPSDVVAAQLEAHLIGTARTHKAPVLKVERRRYAAAPGGQHQPQQERRP